MTVPRAEWLVLRVSSRAAEPARQVPQWLFVFDPAGMATFRILTVLATHPKAMATARDEVDDANSSRRYLPYLRASVLETLRLWPTTPMILRQTKPQHQTASHSQSNPLKYLQSTGDLPDSRLVLAGIKNEVANPLGDG